MLNVAEALLALPAEVKHARQGFLDRKGKIKPIRMGFNIPTEMQYVNAVMQDRGFLQRLMKLYYCIGPHKGQLVEMNGNTLPLLCQKKWIPDTLLDISDITYGWNDAPPVAKLRWEGLADKLRNECGKEIKNNISYRLLSIDPNQNGLHLTFGHGWYEEYVETCEAMAWEPGLAMYNIFTSHGSQIDKFELTGQDLFSKICSLLPHRNTVDPYDFSSLSKTAGISTLTIVHFESEHLTEFIMHQRGVKKKVALNIIPTKEDQREAVEAINTWHVVPAGTFQPLAEEDGFRDIELNIKRNIMREFGEELLDQEQLIGQESILYPDKPFEIDPELKNLKQVFETRNTEVYLLGSTLDCVTLKPELLTLLVINGDRLLPGNSDLRNNWEGKHYLCKFQKEKLNEYLHKGNILAAGAGCLSLCLAHLSEIDGLISSICVAGEHHD